MTIGLIPAAGSASRIHGLPKYLLPIPDGYLLGRHIDMMNAVDVQVVIGVNPDNAAIVYPYAKGSFVHRVDNYATMSETVLSCKIFASTNGVASETVIFGMPDSYIEDDNVYRKLLATIENGAEVAVALFRARPEQHKKVGMCAVALDWVADVIDKPQESKLTWLWGALAWRPVFWNYMKSEDPHIGFALPRAIADGHDVRAVKCHGGYWDCGSWESYSELVVHLHGRKEVAEMTARV